MIKLSNDYEFTFCNGSGALGFDGRGYIWDKPFLWLGLLDPTQFTVVCKTLTLHKTIGNLKWWRPWRCVRLLPNKSAVNCVGLTNPGIDQWIEKYYPIIKKYNFALSIKINNSGEAYTFAAIFDKNFFGFDWLDAKYIEINVSCPNINNDIRDIIDILHILKEKINIPLVLKLSMSQINDKFIKNTEPYVEAYHCMNTIPWNIAYSHKDSPLKKYNLEGGVSGRVIHYQAVEYTGLLKSMTNKPIIGGGGIFDLEDIERFERVGATAFSIGTAFLYNPGNPNKIIRKYNSLKGIS